MPSSPVDNHSIAMLDVERPMLPSKKNSLYQFCNQKGDLSHEEKLQLDTTGLYRYLPRCIRTKFADSQQESLFEAYYQSQKQGDLVAFVITAISFQMFTAITYASRGLDTNRAGELSALVLLILAFVFNCVVVIIYKFHVVSLKEQRTLKLLFPLLVFAVLYANFFLDLAVTHHPLLMSDGVSFQILFIYATLTMLPLRLGICVVLAVASSVGLLVMHGVLGIGKWDCEIIASINLFLGSLALGFLGGFVSDKKQRKAFRQARVTIALKLFLEEESHQQERLLLAVLPKHLASKIRHDLGLMEHGQFKKMYIDRYEDVSILFADIVGFTALSSNCTAAELVKLLNKLIARFDKLSERYHQLRIKILGDCYYCISGAPEKREDHAVLCCHMGLAMVDAIKAVREETKSSVDMRVGIHTGSVLAGVMGQRQYAYDVYSKDTKLANAMESGGIPGHVHISNSTLKCLPNDVFEFKEGHGDERNDDIKKSGLQTWIITKVLRPYPEATLDADKTRLSVQANEPALSSRRGSQRPSGPPRNELNNGGHGEEDFDDRLLQALIEREGATLKEKANYLTLGFNDNKWEAEYGSVREKLGPALITANFFVIVFCCFIHAILWSLNLGTGVAYAAAICICLLISCLSWASVRSRMFPSGVVRFIRWTETVPSLRCVWLSSVVLIAAVPEIADRLACTDPDKLELTCDPPVFYIHLTTFLLLGVTIFIQLRQLAKVLTMVLLVTIHCVLSITVQQDVFDKFDQIHRSHQSLDSLQHLGQRQTVLDLLDQNRRLNQSLESLQPVSDYFTSFSTKYLVCCLLVIILFALFWLNRYTEITSRLLFIWKKQSDAQKEQVSDLRKKNEELVYNILPRHVAKHFLGRALTESEEPYSEQHTAVGVMFASMPNFSDFYTEEGVNNQGIECLRFLNEVISDYDELLDDKRFQGCITKIKTIGATYMAASGLTNTDNSSETDLSSVESWRHLDHLVRFALAMQEKLTLINEQSFNQFQLRIGINHGPISAGVIGARKPHYDIWGNTVNVASRMESTGKPSFIQVTEDTMLLLRDFGYTFESRGEVYVKGKGNLRTFYLIS